MKVLIALIIAVSFSLYGQTKFFIYEDEDLNQYTGYFKDAKTFVLCDGSSLQVLPGMLFTEDSNAECNDLSNINSFNPRIKKDEDIEVDYVNGLAEIVIEGGAKLKVVFSRDQQKELIKKLQQFTEEKIDTPKVKKRFKNKLLK